MDYVPNLYYHLSVAAQPLKLDDNPADRRNGFKLQRAGTPVPPSGAGFVPGEQVAEQLHLEIAQNIYRDP